MQHLINICQTFSEKWAFKFSPTKSNVLRYSKKNKNVTSNLTLYDDIIPLVTSAKHVGILLNCKFRSMDQTLNACRVLRSTALSVLNSGIHPSILNPLTCSKIILQICYSKALYGCELWNNLTQTELTMLERSHRFVCKIIQGLPKRTRSDKCTSLLGWFSVESIINRCKLGRLCRLKSSALPKRRMISRLMEFKHKCVPEQLGFIPDIYKAAEKYNITDYIVNFANTGSFPSKKLWSVIVNQNINASEETWWSYRISCDNDFYMFRHIHSAIKPHKAWTIAKQFPELRVSAKYVIDLCSIVRYEDEHLLCDKCGKFFLNIVEHLLVSCDFIQDKRDDLWQDIININPIQFSVFMDSLSAHEFTTTILSCNTSYKLENEELTFFL
ncbi:MIZ1 [Mytilus edulis]|uniref:ZBTB17 n=1 Tax=Mytilus edulis TaxID=6550 RepID=A0A8S3V8P1_MYTED|nr:MIZ1 [Mytilus edulis]